MERFVYVDGEPFDRVSNAPEEIARSLGAWIARVEPFDDPICGPSERVYLRSLKGQLEAKRTLERLLDQYGETGDSLQRAVWEQELRQVINELAAGPELTWSSTA